MKRLVVLVSVVLFGGSASWLFGAQQPAATPPPTFDANNFVGTVTPHTTTDIRTNRYTFSPGARTNWHSHGEGQVLFAEKGRMRTAEQGKPVQEFPQGTTLHINKAIVHWHGAMPGEPLTQVSVSFGPTTWMAKVTDQEYGAKR
jgi:quercetin dioxygenase-like cupin family protein